LGRWTFAPRGLFINDSKTAGTARVTRLNEELEEDFSTGSNYEKTLKKVDAESTPEISRRVRDVTKSKIAQRFNAG